MQCLYLTTTDGYHVVDDKMDAMLLITRFNNDAVVSVSMAQCNQIFKDKKSVEHVFISKQHISNTGTNNIITSITRKTCRQQWQGITESKHCVARYLPESTLLITTPKVLMYTEML